MRLTETIVSLGLVAAIAGCTGQRSATSTRSPQAPAKDLRFKLATIGDVFVLGCLPRAAETVDLVVHFHGAPQVVEREFTAAGLRAVLVTVNYRGLSSVYEKPFSDPKLFRTLLDETLVELKARELVSQGANWQHVCVSAFSAGFGAVRAVLRVSEHFDRIDTLYLADTLYAGYVQQGDQRKVNPENMRGFRRFAAEAAAGRKTMIVTHSYLEPGSYAGTHETADDLIAFVGAKRRPVDKPGPASMRIVSRVDRGNFHVYGCAGTTGEDHMEHLRNMRFWYAFCSIAVREP